MILAAGLGSRLGKLTSKIPKALITINGKPMLEFTIERLKRQGINKVLVNVHHHADMVLSFLEKQDLGIDIIISDERDALLDTGGALLKAADFFEGDDPILVHNVDIISQLDLNALVTYHDQNESLATLCVRKRKSGRALLFDNKMKLTGWTNIEKQVFKWVGGATSNHQTYAFSGVYLVNPEFVEKIPFTGKFSIIDAWLNMARQENIFGFEDTSDIWFDLGTKEKITAAEKVLQSVNHKTSIF